VILKKLELRRSGLSETDLTKLIELGKLDARLKDGTIAQNDYAAERAALESLN
jgi:hypothetical protein